MKYSNYSDHRFFIPNYTILALIIKKKIGILEKLDKTWYLNSRTF